MYRIAVLDDFERIAKDMADWSWCGVGTEVHFFHEPAGCGEELIERLTDFDIVCLMRERSHLTRTVIETLPRLALIVTAGPRNAAVDLGAAAERGIIVCGTRALAHPTAELVFAHIFEFTRRVGAINAQLKSAATWPAPVGIDLYGKTLGIVGLGRLGKRVATVAHALGMDVIAWSQNLTEAGCAGIPARYVTRDDLCAQADFVSVHLKLSDRTRGIICDTDLRRMKSDAVLINTSRGSIVEETALIDALAQGRIGGACLDVFPEEPLSADHPYRSLERAQITPHRGYCTRDQLRLFYGDMVEDIAGYLAGEPKRLISASDPTDCGNLRL